MKVYFGLPRSFPFPKPVIAVGVFDGVHLAHRRILQAAVKKAGHIQGTAVALTFYPHPQGQKSLYSLEHRIKFIADCGIRVCVVLNFSPALSSLSPEDFLSKVILGKLRAHSVYVGSNFKFGHGAKGDVRLLKRAGLELGFEPRVFARVRLSGRTVSSTVIREYITRGKLKAAQGMLGRPVSVYGTVIKGDSIAGKLGFPTANIDPHHEILPPSGIYAVKVILDERGNDQREIRGVCYIGTRPTLGKDSDNRVEVHLFDFKRDLYGKNLLINFIFKIRDDRKFSSLEGLKEQVVKDIALAKERLP